MMPGQCRYQYGWIGMGGAAVPGGSAVRRRPLLPGSRHDGQTETGEWEDEMSIKYEISVPGEGDERKVIGYALLNAAESIWIVHDPEGDEVGTPTMMSDVVRALVELHLGRAVDDKERFLKEVGSAVLKLVGRAPSSRPERALSDTVTVCDHCMQASCWQGVFHCDDYQTAGTVEKTIDELRELGLESPTYWYPPETWDPPLGDEMSKTICLDFDGVLHSYESGWQGADKIPDDPVPGAMDFLYDVLKDERFNVVIYSSRSSHDGGIGAMESWLVEHFAERFGNTEETKDLLGMNLKFVTSKPGAFLTIDDRAMLFTGVWPELDWIDAFKPWNKRTRGVETISGMSGVERMSNWKSIASAPRDGTLILLLCWDDPDPLVPTVNPTEDDVVWRTIGFNHLAHTGVDKWDMAGWCWSHDNFTAAKGVPTHWIEMPDAELNA